MTFGASHIGGNWKSGQGVCGMVKDDKDGINWAWNPSMKYIQEDSTDYGERLGALASFYQDSYNNAMKNPPTTPQKVINVMMVRNAVLFLYYWLSWEYLY